jgi:F0F1-type ATP synthase membrane subunit b/b'
MKKALRCAGFIALFFFLEGTPVLAQEGESSPADSAVGWVFRWLNFAIVFGAIAYFAVKKGTPYFRAAAEGISQKIAEATHARDAAEQRRREATAKLANLDHDIERLRADAKREAGFEAERLRTAAREEAQKIERAAQAEIAAAERAARLELKGLGARLALERAEVMLRQELTPVAEAALFDKFMSELRRDVN